MRIVGLWLVLGLAGCASGGSNGSGITNAQQRAGIFAQALTQLSGQRLNCTKQLLQNPDHAAAAAIFPLHDSNTLTVAQLSSPSRPTTADMRRIIAFGQGFNQCWMNVASPTRSVDPVFSNIIETNLRENNLIIADMAQRRLTLGDANRRMQSEDARIGERIQTHGQQLLAGFQQQHLSELALRQAQAAADQAAMAALGEQLQQMGRDFNASAQTNLYNSSLYRAPQVQNFAPPQNTIVNCFQTGPIVHCR